MSQKPDYELIDHTADFGIRVYGPTVKELFHNAALALMEQLMEACESIERQTRQLKVEGDDWPDLMVNWLREILYLWVGEELLVRAVRIETVSDSKLSARLETEVFSPQHHLIKTEIKAVTYHQIQVADVGHQWEARIIFDI